jgi:predicted component of type VI protein secretion system
MGDLSLVRRKHFGDFWSKFYGAPSTETQLYDCVLRNLHAIFADHRQPLTPEQTEEFPETRDSVINRAVRDFSSGRLEPADYAKHMAWAIRTFENRLDSQTIQVRYMPPPTNKSRPQWIFRIDGNLWTERGGSTFRCFVMFDLDSRVSVFN